MLFIGTANPPSKWHSIWMKGKRRKKKKRNEKKREKENLVSKLDSVRMRKRMEVNILKITEIKDANYRWSNKPQALSKFHFMEYTLRNQQLYGIPYGLRSRCFPHRVYVPIINENLGTFHLKRLLTCLVCKLCPFFVCDARGEIWSLKESENDSPAMIHCTANG